MSQKLTQNLDLRQQQNLVMTPQMQQAIKLLQMSNLELQDYIEAEMAQNPLLEKDESKASEDEDNAELPSPLPPPESDDFDAGSAFLAQNSAGGSHQFLEDDEFSATSLLTKPVSLREYLDQQVMMSFDSNRDRSLASFVIDRLDESGYLREDIAVIASQIGCPEERLQSIYNILRLFDPVGVFAKDLADCLRLQLEDQNEWTPEFETMLTHLPLIAAHDLKQLSTLCGCSEADIRTMIAKIKTLNPKPSSEFDHVVVQTAIPDILMKALPKNQGGGWRVELNSETLPKVLVNQTYYTEVTSKSKDKKERDYITTQLNNANWIVRSLEQRAHTILKVASEIVDQQDGFFLYGIEFLKPLTLREIAEKIDMHESTVSRVTMGKFIGTPRGLFELKFFFTSSIEGADGHSVSSQAVKSRIKALTDAEDPQAILSDDDLVDVLQKENIDIARRTVAKYREALNIPSSVQRRRMKKI
jgi:RNA polymerase sigma-54 factor